MKKILSIALIAVLVASSVFAATFTGSAALEFVYNLDGEKDYGFDNPHSEKLKFGFELGSGEGGKAGEKDLRAEIAGTFKVEFKEAEYKKDATLSATVTKLEITKANILYKDILTVGILDAGSSADYVSSYITASADIKDLADDKKVLVNKGKTVSNLITALNGVPGFTVEAYGVKGGFGLTGKADETKVYNVLAHAALADKELAEGFTLSAGVGALLVGKKDSSTNTLQANLKGAYSQDKLSASLAVDFQTVLEKDKDAKVGVEASAAASYDFVSLNAYFYIMDKENAILDAKVAANKTFEIDENVSVTVKGSFEANNVADKTRHAKDYTTRQINNGKQEFTPALEASCTVDKFTFGAGASYGIKAKALAINGSVKYAPEEFTAEVKGTFKKTIEVEKSNVLTLEASISSDKVIDGATLSLAYAGSKNLLKDQTGAEEEAKKQTFGKITASAKVEF